MEAKKMRITITFDDKKQPKIAIENCTANQIMYASLLLKHKAIKIDPKLNYISFIDSFIKTALKGLKAKKLNHK